jgi:hypothetical protein
VDLYLHCAYVFVAWCLNKLGENFSHYIVVCILHVCVERKQINKLSLNKIITFDLI